MLNALGSSLSREEWIIGGKDRYTGRDNYGVMLKRYDPIAFEVGYNEWNMEEKLILNSIEDAEIISVRLSPDETPIAYENRVRCLMLSGLSREEAEKVALEPMDLELYYEIGAGLMAVDPAAVESGTIWSPYTRELYDDSQIFSLV